MRLTRTQAWAFAGFCRNWPSPRPGWTNGGAGDRADLSAAMLQPEAGDPFVQLAVMLNGGAVDITADQVAEAFGAVAEAFVLLTGRKGMVGDLVQNPEKLAGIFDAYARGGTSEPEEPRPSNRGDAFEPAPAVAVRGIVGPSRAAFGGGR